jgi:hypothetical protein
MKGVIANSWPPAKAGGFFIIVRSCFRLSTISFVPAAQKNTTFTLQQHKISFQQYRRYFNMINYHFNNMKQNINIAKGNFNTIK